MLTRIGTAAGLVALCALSILRIARPPSAVPATAPDTVFSAERALRHVAVIAQRPHPAGTVDHDRVRDYIVSQLTAMGIPAEAQRTTAVGTRYQAAGRVQNVLASLPGRDRKGKALLLVAHYDGVGASPAAADDGAGCAALLETLRALRARRAPLTHNVIVLFSDGEEDGLLGAAAFVRENPLAGQVAMVLNFEARGTGGRSLMFETGPGNLDAARILRNAGDATAGSVFTTVYRALPNDTDLSELAALNVPAMNFAFADGVERYHTSRDDLAHLDPRSVQDHGNQMLTLAKLIGNGPLPRIRTGDGVFFDLPLAGLVVYPESWSLPLAVVAALLVVALAVQDRVGVAVGAATAVVAATLSAIVGAACARLVTEPAAWSGVYAGAIVLLALAATLAAQAVAVRWSTRRGLRVGAMIVWAVLALAVSARAPGGSYLFIWPLVFTAVATLVTRGRVIADWVAAAVSLIMLAGIIYGVAVVLLGLAGPGAVVAAILTSLIAGLLLPQVEVVAGRLAWPAVAWCVAGSIVLALFGRATVHPDADHPQRSALIYAEDADSATAWLGTALSLNSAWVRAVVGASERGPTWTNDLAVWGSDFTGHRAKSIALAAPNAVLVRDTVISGARRITLRVNAPPGTTHLVLQARGARVLESSIDGRVVDPTRYRYRSPAWSVEYSAMSDSGATVGLSVPAGARIELALAAWRPGLPPGIGVAIPERPPSVAQSQDGDASVIYRTLRF